jgi:hypothetical protein
MPGLHLELHRQNGSSESFDKTLGYRIPVTGSAVQLEPRRRQTGVSGTLQPAVVIHAVALNADNRLASAF